MTISSTTRVAGPFIGDGTTAIFPFAFKVFEAVDLEVATLNVSSGAISPLALTADYTVALNVDQDTTPGGSITLTAGNLATGLTLTITTDMPEVQGLDLANAGGFYPDVMNDAFDKIVILIQQLQVQLARAIQVPFTDSDAGVILPQAISRANSFLGFDAAGAPAVIPIVTATPSFGIVSIAFSATPVFLAAAGSVLKIVLTGNVISSAFNGAGGGTFILIRVVQDAVGGRTFVWPTNLRNAGMVSGLPNSVSDQLFAVDQDGSARAVAPIMYS